MKKYFLMLITAAAFSTSVHAGAAHFPESHPFRISSAGMMYMYWNDAEFPQHFRLYVNKTIKDKPADTVILTCNSKKVTAITGDWTTCEVAPHKPVSFTITKEDFKNGAEGVSERSY